MEDLVSMKRELKIMHACELGAVGVYRGHKCVARYVFRQALVDLDKMRSHEINHVLVFRQLLNSQRENPCSLYQLFFLGGLIYGVAVGLLGLRAIGESTRTIEAIVVHELDCSLDQLSEYKEISEVIQKVRIDELSHQNSGTYLVGDGYLLSGIVSTVATKSAYLAKYFASVL